MGVLTTIEPVTATPVELPLASKEQLGARVNAPAGRLPDTGIAPRWIITTSANAPDDDAAGWTSGSWVGVVENGTIEALSPMFGDDPDAEIQLTSRGQRNVYMTFTALSGEKPIRKTHRLTST